MNNDIQNFLTQLTESSFYHFSPLENTVNVSLDSVFAHVTSSKFRKTKLDDESSKDIRSKIGQCVDQHLPIKFSIPFGAYKAWRLNLQFTPDWAEVFNMSFLMEYASYILEVYPFGVEFYYTFSDDLMYFVSDIPRDAARKYVTDFQLLLDIFNSIHPLISFSLIKINLLYDTPEDYYIDFLRNFLDNLVFWDRKYDSSTKNRHLTSAHHNVNLYGERDIAEQSDDIREKYYYYAALMTDAVDCLRERRKYNKDQDRIQLVGVKGPSKSINIGACRTSTVHFWTGRGCLQINKGCIKPFILTYSKLKPILESGRFNIYPVETVFGKISDNFNTILFLLP